jgi:hypothetical protein
MQINIGDTVVCYDTTGFDMGHLIQGQRYVVEKVTGANIRLVGVAFSTKVWRFIEPKQGKSCIK